MIDFNFRRRYLKSDDDFVITFCASSVLIRAILAVGDLRWPHDLQTFLVFHCTFSDNPVK
ncbi:hypothetical protein FC15_GL001222 [Lapidilactobacillus concavus DSM 17758]|uniref:Uncharacterized protein n=1 Tax=Lapidilactobacillus concavus DSM 17758 TaxID=1423735 RepID=A0A0R1W3D6_9LACO|nr:hypothetical protein FC15_GL001222 [Lapidilactobacillus concavus DSM 17758]